MQMLVDADTLDAKRLLDFLRDDITVVDVATSFAQRIVLITFGSINRRSFILREPYLEDVIRALQSTGDGRKIWSRQARGRIPERSSSRRRQSKT